jgi:hypothetical protein
MEFLVVAMYVYFPPVRTSSIRQLEKMSRWCGTASGSWICKKLVPLLGLVSLVCVNE